MSRIITRSRLAIGSLGLVAVVSLFGLAGCGRVSDPWEGKGGPTRVVSSFPPATAFVRAIGGDRVSVMTLCTTTGPHDYRYSVRSTIPLQTAHLLIGNGLGLDDSFLDRLNSNSGNKKLRLVKLGEAIKASDLLENPHAKDGKHDHGDGECNCGDGPNDPHVWLNIDNAITMVNVLRDELEKADPAGASVYKENAERFINQLKELHNEGKQQLKDLKAPLITYHDSMGYLAKSFNLKRLGSIQNNPGVEPNARKLEKLIEDCKPYRRVVVAVEPQYPTSAADTLIKALKDKRPDLEVVVVTLDPMETCEADADLNGAWYLEKMRRNYSELAKAVR